MASPRGFPRAVLLRSSPLIFVTVGSQLPFDRLVFAADAWARRTGRVDVLAQVGAGRRPEAIRSIPSLGPEEFDSTVRGASVVVAHAGMGVILTALRHGKPVVVMPRQAERSEHRNDHQRATVEGLKDLRGVFVAADESELSDRIDQALEFRQTIDGSAMISPSASASLQGAVRSFIERGDLEEGDLVPGESESDDLEVGEAEASDESLRRTVTGRVVAWCYPRLGAVRRWRIARALMAIILRVEGGAIYSFHARELMRRHHDVEVGAYSYGELFDPAVVPPGVRIGRYTSIARGVRFFTQNHPMDDLSTHPFFYDPRLGIVAEDVLEAGEIRVGSDVWIGANAVITPGCKSIGDGAIVGAGSVVTHDVPPFTVVAGNPARTIRSRFEDRVAARIAAEEWWQLPIHQLRKRQDLRRAAEVI